MTGLGFSVVFFIGGGGGLCGGGCLGGGGGRFNSSSSGGELMQQEPSFGQYASESMSSQNNANKPPTHSPLHGGPVGPGVLGS